jgi:ADP-ribose pyrophosphatase YjhB (NUDIX family)
MFKYSSQTRVLVAVDCIIVGFDGTNYKLLIVNRGYTPEREKWSLMGGFLKANESLDESAQRIVKQLTGLENTFMEQLHSFSMPNRDPVERVVGVAYMVLIDIEKYQKQNSKEFQAGWFKPDQIPKLIYDHEEMVEMAFHRLRSKATFQPILFELLPEKFTMPKLQALYENLFATKIDKRNFTRKLILSKIIKKTNEKDKTASKKGAFYYTLNPLANKENFQNTLNLIPKREMMGKHE